MAGIVRYGGRAHICFMRVGTEAPARGSRERGDVMLRYNGCSGHDVDGRGTEELSRHRRSCGTVRKVGEVNRDIYANKTQ